MCGDLDRGVPHDPFLVGHQVGACSRCGRVLVVVGWGRGSDGRGCGHGGSAECLVRKPRQFRLDQLLVGPVPLTDVQQWARIEPLLPGRTPKRGGRWRDHREVIDAIAFKFQTGTQWVHLPEKYGNWRGVYAGCGCGPSTARERAFTALMAQADADEPSTGPCRWTRWSDQSGRPSRMRSLA
ncbi:transposase [Streptomyces decoyicus]|uniref:transposase n=1 Tax=Streptomyces decoyicus TaxID=249567 RepID=UPI00398D151A